MITSTKRNSADTPIRVGVSVVNRIGSFCKSDINALNYKAPFVLIAREVDSLEARTSFECAITYSLDLAAQGDALDILTAFKCTVSDSCNEPFSDNTRNYYICILARTNSADRVCYASSLTVYSSRNAHFIICILKDAVFFR